MSKGLGKLQRAMLAGLASGPDDVPNLAGPCSKAHLEACRRAMASLVRRKKVVPLVVRRHGRKLFALPSDAIKFYGLEGYIFDDI